MKKRNYKSLTAVVLLLALLTGTIPVQAAPAVNNGTMGQVTYDPSLPTPPDTFSETAVLMDAETGAVLYGKGQDDIRYPASITKLMTLLLAVENASLEDQVTFTETGIREVTPDSGNIGMQLGEVMSMESCLYAAIIQSANEVSTQIAEYVGGTEEHFIEMMNQKAQELGCKNTHFVNANGMPDENHYSTAYDMALIMQAGLKNETFRKIIGTQSYTIPATNLSKKRKLHTHLPLLAEESPLCYQGCLGGKTGLTQASQNTMVVAAERDGAAYIVVTMRDAELSQNCADSIGLLDYAFNNVQKAPEPSPTPEPTPEPSVAEEPLAETGSLEDQSLPDDPAENAGNPGNDIESIDDEDGQEQQGLAAHRGTLLVIGAVMAVILLILCIALARKRRKHVKY